MTESKPIIRNRCFGYARVSTDDQDLSLQLDALIRFGVAQADIFTDRISGAKKWLFRRIGVSVLTDEFKACCVE